jgi:hypothetical protein
MSVCNLKFVIKLFRVTEIKVVYINNCGIRYSVIFSHVIEVIKQRSKIWYKGTIKCLIVTFGRTCWEDNIYYKFTLPLHYSGHIMKTIIIRNSLKCGVAIHWVVGKHQDLEKILRVEYINGFRPFFWLYLCVLYYCRFSFKITISRTL